MFRKIKLYFEDKRNQKHEQNVKRKKIKKEWEELKFRQLTDSLTIGDMPVIDAHIKRLAEILIYNSMSAGICMIEIELKRLKEDKANLAAGMRPPPGFLIGIPAAPPYRNLKL